MVATSSYCKRCSKDRRQKAATHLELRPITPEEVLGEYRLPRVLRFS